jgi:hypothetical protein
MYSGLTIVGEKLDLVSWRSCLMVYLKDRLGSWPYMDVALESKVYSLVIEA